MKTLNMNFIRYLNLFEKVTRIRCKNCLIYNSAIIFSIPNSMIPRAVGENGENVKRISEILGKRIKIIPLPRDRADMFRFISAIVNPIEVKKIEINGDDVIIAADMDNKAALIGRKKARLDEMREILKQYFSIKDVRIA